MNRSERPSRKGGHAKPSARSPQRSGTPRRSSAGTRGAGASPERSRTNAAALRGTRQGSQRQREAATARSRRAPSTADLSQRTIGSSQRPASRSAKGQASYSTPSLWGAGQARGARTSGSAADGNPVLRVLRAIGSALLAALALLAKGLSFLAQRFAGLLRSSHTARVASAIVLALVLVGAIDFGLNAGKAYPGVRIGSVDVSGMTQQEIESAVTAAYSPRLEAASLTIYASEDAQKAAAGNDAAYAQQLTGEEERASATSWTASAQTLSATLPVQTLTSQALAVGRDDGGVISRLGSLLFGTTVPAIATLNTAAVETLASNIDAAIGQPLVDSGIQVANGVASVTQGHDGDMVNRSTFSQTLSEHLLADDSASGSFVATVEYAPMRIDAATAQLTADRVNAAIADGIQFTYGDTQWKAEAAEVGSWVTTTVQQSQGAYELRASLAMSVAKPAIAASSKQNLDQQALVVDFTKDDQGNVKVTCPDGGTIVQAAQAVDALNAQLFDQGGKAFTGATGQPVSIDLEQGSIPESMSFDEAMDLGVIETISSFTTTFSTGSGTENRNHNIALAGSLLNNSITQPGEVWSFNGTAGDCSQESRGFLGAGAIVDGQYDDAVGGGICQVATTVFNAVYEAGLDVVTRHNHSLYISSYPQGRDAAVSWPDLDFRWENDTGSTLLMGVSSDESSITVTLYGVNPGRTVTTQTGNWEEGEKYETETTVDESLATGVEYVKTRGADGSKISVVRTVKAKDGTIVHQDTFSSTYDPVTEVIVKGPDAGDKNSDTGTSSKTTRT